MKTILFLDHTPFIGGAQLSLIQHLNCLDKNKFNILIGCSAKAVELGLTENYKKIGANYFILPLEKNQAYSIPAAMHFTKSILELKKLIKEKNVDLVISNTVRMAIIGSLASFMCKVKNIWLIRDLTFPRIFFSFFSFFPIKIIFNSQAAANKYQGLLLNRTKISVIYVGRDFYKKMEKIDAEIVSQLKKKYCPNNEKLIGYIGRLVSSKGPQVLVRAMSLLVKKGEANIKCLIAGTGEGQVGDNENELKGLVKTLGLDKYVIFTGYVKEIVPIVMALDVYVLPSIEPESFSSSIIDAMMAKVPVIGTNIGGTQEIVVNRKTGLLIASNNENELAEAIINLFSDKILLNILIAESYKKVMQYYTAEFATKKLSKLYEEVLLG